MRDDLPPGARMFIHASGSVLSGLGAAMWLLGSALSMGIGLIFAVMLSFPIKEDKGELWAMWIALFGALALSIIGCAMHFFSQTLIEHKPKKVPTDLLPRWWFTQFMRPLCLQLAIVSVIGVYSCMFRLDPIGVLWAFGLWAGIRGFRHFRMKTIQLSPPYPPRSGPPKW